MKTFSAVRYIDPGHSWVKVKRSVLHRLGIAYKVSPYSYQRNDYVYLEEDCDETLLREALERHDTVLRITNKHANKSSKIRSYEHYRPALAVSEKPSTV